MFPDHPGSAIGRRRLLKGSLAVGGLSAAGLAGAPVAGGREIRATVQPRRFGATVQPTAGLRSGFSLPGLLHTQADFDRMAAKVAARRAPWIGGWDRLVANSHSSATWQPRPLATVIRGGTGQNYPQLYRDIHAAYQNALRWKVTGDERHGPRPSPSSTRGRGPCARSPATPTASSPPASTVTRSRTRRRSCASSTASG